VKAKVEYDDEDREIIKPQIFEEEKDDGGNEKMPVLNNEAILSKPVMAQKKKTTKYDSYLFFGADDEW